MKIVVDDSIRSKSQRLKKEFAKTALSRTYPKSDTHFCIKTSKIEFAVSIYTEDDDYIEFIGDTADLGSYFYIFNYRYRGPSKKANLFTSVKLWCFNNIAVDRSNIYHKIKPEPKITNSRYANSWSLFPVRLKDTLPPKVAAKFHFYGIKYRTASRRYKRGDRVYSNLIKLWKSI